MASKKELYRKQVAMVVGIQLGITQDQATEKLTEHFDSIDAWCVAGLQFTQSAFLLLPEINPAYGKTFRKSNPPREPLMPITEEQL